MVKARKKAKWSGNILYLSYINKTSGAKSKYTH